MSSINSISTSLSQQYIMILSKQRLQNDKSDRVQTAEGSMLQWVPYWLWKSMLTSREECQLQPVSLNYPGAIGICPKPWHAALATKYVSGKSTYMAWRMICSPQTPWNSPNNWWRISPLFPTIYVANTNVDPSIHLYLIYYRLGHPMGQLHIYLHEWRLFMVNVGKYLPYIECLGFECFGVWNYI